MRVGVLFDMRSPEFGVPAARLYHEALQQASFADAVGFDLALVSEHHGAEDGYLPSPLTLAAAIAGCTSRLRLRLAAMLLPMYHPVRAAEDLAVLDLVSGGRLEVVVGGGYRPEEFAMFQVEPGQRGRLVEDGVRLLRQAWAGEDVTYGGHTFRVTPRPVQPGGPPLLLGGSTPVVARRAARIADGFLPTDPALQAPYAEECARLGKDPDGYEHRSGPMFVHVAEDPDAAWRQIEPHALHETNSYAAWLAAVISGPFETATDGAALRAGGNYQVLTPEECLALMHDLEARGEAAFVLRPLMGGMDPDVGWEGLRLFAEQVLPRWRAASAGLRSDSSLPGTPASG